VAARITEMPLTFL